MKRNITVEISILIAMIIPMAYLLLVWKELPESLPMHYDINGTVDRMGSKSELLWIVTLLNVAMYLILFFVPVLDPKKNVEKMGNKFTKLRLILGLFISVLSIFLIYSSKSNNFNTNAMLTIIGLLFAALGNYFQSIRPNYFVGIRTPWTLENETTWKATHRLAGKLWFFGGLVIVVLALLIPYSPNLFKLVMGFILLMAAIPVVYSYFHFKKQG